jgi:hypothetical protein
MNLHEGFQIGARVQINDKENEHRFYGKHGIVIDHPHIWYSKVLCDDGSVWSGNKCYLSLSQRPTMLAPDLGQAARLKVKIQLPQAGNANR